jgi:hypothetical protein
MTIITKALIADRTLVPATILATAFLVERTIVMKGAVVTGWTIVMGRALLTGHAIFAVTIFRTFVASAVVPHPLLAS